MAQAKHPKCAGCGHPKMKHANMAGPNCGVRIPVRWSKGKRPQPIQFGYCPCTRYTTEET